DFAALALVILFDLFALHTFTPYKCNKILKFTLTTLLLLLIIVSHIYMNFFVDEKKLTVTAVCNAHLFKLIYLMLMTRILLVVQIIIASFGFIVKGGYAIALALIPAILLIIVWISLKFSATDLSACIGVTTVI
ncbi:MAG: hypothetical protein ACK4M7_02430, partial [Burkholderiales bacterium]